MKSQHQQHETECQSPTSIPRFRSAYGPRFRVPISFPEQPYGRTKQSFRDETNINNIMAKYQSTGLITFVNNNQAQYGDVTGLDFQTAMTQIKAAEELFSQLPSSWRKRFNNDPATFLSFVDDEANRPEAIALGLIKSPDPTPQGVGASTPTGVPGASGGGVAK